VKRSEVTRRLAPSLKSLIDRSILERGVLFTEEGAIESIATALGIEVEPDEEPLPERLGMTVAKGRFGYTALSDEDSIYVTTTDPDRVTPADRSLALLDALISAYNERPRWRTGVPDEDGWYLVATQYGGRDCARWGMGSWWRIEGELRFPATVAHWMPLPAAPK
jgi:hypothetical protein